MKKTVLTAMMFIPIILASCNGNGSYQNCNYIKVKMDTLTVDKTFNKDALNNLKI